MHDPTSSSKRRSRCSRRRRRRRPGCVLAAPVRPGRALAGAGGAALPMLRPRDAAAAGLASPLRPTRACWSGVPGRRQRRPQHARPGRGRSTRPVRGAAAQPGHPGRLAAPRRRRLGPAPEAGHGSTTLPAAGGWRSCRARACRLRTCRTSRPPPRSCRAGWRTRTGTGWLGRFVDGLPDGERGAGDVGGHLGADVFCRPAGPHHVRPERRLDVGRRPVRPGRRRAVRRRVRLRRRLQRARRLGRPRERHRSLRAADAATLSRAFDQGAGPPGLAHDLLVAARLINLDLGARVVGVTVGGFDTHTTQAGPARHADAGPRRRHRDVLRQPGPGASSAAPPCSCSPSSDDGPQANGALGTDHGTAAPMLVVGDNVKGGLARRRSRPRSPRRPRQPGARRSTSERSTPTCCDGWLRRRRPAGPRRELRWARPLRGGSGQKRSYRAGRTGPLSVSAPQLSRWPM